MFVFRKQGKTRRKIRFLHLTAAALVCTGAVGPGTEVVTLAKAQEN